MHIQLNIKQATVDGQDGIYIEESLCSRGQIVGRIDSSFHVWEKGGVNYDIAGTVLPHLYGQDYELYLCGSSSNIMHVLRMHVCRYV